MKVEDSVRNLKVGDLHPGVFGAGRGDYWGSRPGQPGMSSPRECERWPKVFVHLAPVFVHAGKLWIPALFLGLLSCPYARAVPAAAGIGERVFLICTGRLD